MVEWSSERNLLIRQCNVVHFPTMFRESNQTHA